VVNSPLDISQNIGKLFYMSNKLFNDPQFEETFRQARNIIVTIWIVCILGGLTLIGGLGYVAYHFLSKMW
jgi:hypothetical protein